MTVFADSVQWKKYYIIYLSNKFNTNFRRYVGELMTNFQRGMEKCMESHKEKIVIVQLTFISGWWLQSAEYVFSMNDPITFSWISTEHEKQIVFRSSRLMWERGQMVVLNAPGKYQCDLRNHLLVNLFPIALDAAITTSNVNNHELHRNNIPATGDAANLLI